MKLKFEHYRHATSIIEVNGKRILIDPLLAKKKSYPPIVLTRNPQRNPLIDLPCNFQELFRVDGVVITHDHNDHFDELAKKRLPKDLPILCQPSDLDNFSKLGFTRLTTTCKKKLWLGLNVSSVLGSHGGGLLKKKLGKSSAFMLEDTNGIKIFISGDTLLTSKMISIISNFEPNYVIAYGGGARLKLAGQITMNNLDILKLSNLFQSTKIIAVHMDSINHCFDKRESLKKLNIYENLFIPNDGEKLHI